MRWRKPSHWFLAATLCFVAITAAVAWRTGGDLVAPANQNIGPPPCDLPFESFTLPSDSGSAIATWYLPKAPEGVAATVVLLHPLRGSRRSMLERATLFHRAGYAVVLIDLQAHGESPGQYLTAGFLERKDVEAAVTFAREIDPGHRIAVVGRSLGGAAALLASPLPIDALVLESVYPTIEEAVSNRLRIRLGALSALASPLLLWQFRLRLGIAPAQLRPIERLALIDHPVLIMGGDIDRHTTLPETLRLFDAARDPKTLAIFPGAVHIDLLAFDPTRYEREVLGFLERNLVAGLRID
ncbi:MAG: alpha/beta fold hydrolase [Deltaproteobacteria bacterium]|nr:alpha/beta fold hydrolase [Deltaproteobacteria bacterium]